MDSWSLTPGQLAKFRQSVARQADYLQRLTARMERQSFPAADRVRVNAVKARRAVEALLQSIPTKPIRDAYPPFKDPPPPR